MKFFLISDSISTIASMNADILDVDSQLSADYENAKNPSVSRFTSWNSSFVGLYLNCS